MKCVSPKAVLTFWNGLHWEKLECIVSLSVMFNSLWPHSAGQEYWSGLPFSSLGDLPDPGIKPGSPTLQADSFPSEPPGNVVVRDLNEKTMGSGPSLSCSFTTTCYSPPLPALSKPVCCRKGHPFQGPRVGSCLTLENELSEETHILTKQETLLWLGARLCREHQGKGTQWHTHGST